MAGQFLRVLGMHVRIGQVGNERVTQAVKVGYAAGFVAVGDACGRQVLFQHENDLVRLRHLEHLCGGRQGRGERRQSFRQLGAEIQRVIPPTFRVGSHYGHRWRVRVEIERCPRETAQLTGSESRFDRQPIEQLTFRAGHAVALRSGPRGHEQSAQLIGQQCPPNVSPVRALVQLGQVCDGRLAESAVLHEPVENPFDGREVVIARSDGQRVLVRSASVRKIPLHRRGGYVADVHGSDSFHECGHAVSGCVGVDGGVAFVQKRALEVGDMLVQWLARRDGPAVQESELGESLADAVGQ
ncbi:MAG: hypothetical protein O7D91_01970 [Planctomycetota bacterium]|nr:hypothetical protein [Planctomycetota bacterium]